MKKEQERNMGKRVDVSLIFFVLFSAVVCVESYRMGLGSLNSPNVGLFPFLIGCLLGLLAAVRLCASLFSKSAIHAPKISIPFARILPLLACLFAYVLLMNEVGFILSSFFLVVFLLKVIEPKPWLVTLPLGVGISLGAYFVFRVLLGIQLPEGILAF